MSTPRWIRTFQYLSIFIMWCFAAGVLIFVPWLVVVANRWHDAPDWSLTISLIMTPVYLIVAGTLTYVFFGLQRGMPGRNPGTKGNSHSENPPRTH